jgi:hypothetical protein
MMKSPFLDQEVLRDEPRPDFDPALARLAKESPFERLSIEGRSADPPDEETGGVPEDAYDFEADYTKESPYVGEPELDDEIALAEECEDGPSRAEELEFDEEFNDLAPACPNGISAGDSRSDRASGQRQ